MGRLILLHLHAQQLNSLTAQHQSGQVASAQTALGWPAHSGRIPRLAQAFKQDVGPNRISGLTWLANTDLLSLVLFASRLARPNGHQFGRLSTRPASPRACKGDGAQSHKPVELRTRPASLSALGSVRAPGGRAVNCNRFPLFQRDPDEPRSH